MIYLVILAMLSIVPLYVWGATGDWRHAITAARQYLKIMGAFLLLGGGLAVLMTIAGQV
jgi:hypothetical protein